MKFLLCFFLALTLQAQKLKVVSIGDSHATVNVDMEQELTTCLAKSVAYTNIAIAGSRTQGLLRSLTEHKGKFWNRLSKVKDPDILMVAFGSNDGVLAKQPLSYDLAWRSLIGELKRRYPKTRIIIIGPPACRGRLIPLLPSIVVVQKSVARIEGLQFIDRSAMATHELQSDGIHYSYKGYKEMAHQVVLQIQRKTW